jgi:hypothetical protein
MIASRNAIRRAHPEDVSALFSVLTDVSSEIPLPLDEPEKQRIIRERVEEACSAELAWVAIDDDHNTVGFLIGKNRKIDIWGMEFSGVELLYGGVKKKYRHAGRFQDLLNEAKALAKPLCAVVKHKNASSMATVLVKYGFEKQTDSLRPDEDRFVWTPKDSTVRK